jgi:hypothetical protein
MRTVLRHLMQRATKFSKRGVQHLFGNEVDDTNVAFTTRSGRQCSPSTLIDLFLFSAFFELQESLLSFEAIHLRLNYFPRLSYFCEGLGVCFHNDVWPFNNFIFSLCRSVSYLGSHCFALCDLVFP